jgi:hypothetical protein
MCVNGKLSGLYIAYGVKTVSENEKNGYNHPLPVIRDSDVEDCWQNAQENGLDLAGKCARK